MRSEDAVDAFRHAFANAAIGFAMADLGGRVQDVNEVYCRLSGYSRNELVSRRLSDFIHPEDIGEFLGQLKKLLAGQIPGFAMENRHVHKSGRNLWVRKSISVVPDADGESRWVLALLEDITDRKIAEAELQTAKAEAERANLAKSKFLASASHDLRQPVQSLVLLMSAIKNMDVSPPVNKALTVMEDALEGLNGLLTSLLDVSRLDAGVVMPQMAETDVGASLSRLANEYAILAASKGLRIKSVTRSVQIRTDPALMDRILRNLIENAIRYTEKGGLLLGVRLHRGMVRIEVVDSGIGIPSDKLPHIFEEFYQIGNPARDRSQGLGLGLAIVRRTAKLLGVEIAVCSRVGGGTRFSVLAPAGSSA